MPDEAEVLGLVALMLLHDSRRATRIGAAGELVLLADQDRSRWDHAEIDEGVRAARPACGCAARALPATGGDRRPARPGAGAADTDWEQIAALYARCSSSRRRPSWRSTSAVAVAETGRVERGARADRRDRGARGLPPDALGAGRPAAAARVGSTRRAAPTSARAELARNPAERAFLGRVSRSSRAESARSGASLSPRRHFRTNSDSHLGRVDDGGSGRALARPRVGRAVRVVRMGAALPGLTAVLRRASTSRDAGPATRPAGRLQ